MAEAEAHHGHHDLDTLNRFEQDRGKISWEHVEAVIDSLPKDVIKKIRDIFTGKEDGVVDDEKEGYKLFSYYLATLYQLDAEDAFARVEALEEDDQRKLIRKITGDTDPDAVIDDEDPGQLRKLLTHFKLHKEGRFAKIFLALYEEKFGLKKPTDALLTGVPSEKEIEDQIDQCVNTGGPAITRLRIASIAKLKKIAEHYKISDDDFPEVLDRIEAILERLQAEEKKTDGPERDRDEAKRTLDEKTADLNEPKEEERLAKEDMDRERERLLEKPKENLTRAEKKLSDAQGDEKDARWRFEKAHELYIKAQEVAAKQTPPGPVDSKDLDEARVKLKEMVENLDKAKGGVRDAQAAVDKVEDQDLKTVKDAHALAKKARIDAERALEPLKRALRDRERDLTAAKGHRKPVAQELKDISKGDVHAQLKKFFDKLELKKKTATESLPKIQPGEAIVYLCLRREREAKGEKSEYLEQRTAASLATLAVGVTAVDFAGIEAPGKGVASRGAYEARKGAAAFHPAEWFRASAAKIFEQIPLLHGLTLRSSEHEIKHHFEKEPVAILVELLGYLRHEAVDQRGEGLLKGISFGSLTDLEKFVRVLEEIVAEKMGGEIAKGGDKAWEKAYPVLDASLHKPLAHVAHKFDEVKKDLKKHHPAGGTKGEGPHGGAKGGAGEALTTAGKVGAVLAGIGHVGDFLRGRKGSGGGAGKKEEKGGGDGGHGAAR